MKKSVFLLFAIISVVGMLAISGCKKTYIVTFNANGGTGTMSAQTFTEGEAQALARNAFTYDGYTFIGWNTVQDGSGVSYTDGQTITVTADIKLYAQWSASTLTVTFNANGGIGDMAAQTFYAGESQSLMANAFTRENYWFVGWNTANDGTGTTYADRQSITLTDNITLYAIWSLGVTGNKSGHNYVDLGLPSSTKWATCNVGATTPDGYGDYFAWGETITKETYNWFPYEHFDGSNFTKYTSSDNLTILEASDDAATANWGTDWRMPTKEEMSELFNNCSHIWTTQNGVNGRLFTGPNGNSIFLPAAGTHVGIELCGVGSSSTYWSSSLDEDIQSYAWRLWFGFELYGMDSYARYFGQTVRPVCASQN